MAEAKKKRLYELRLNDLVTTEIVGIDDVQVLQGPPGEDGYTPKIELVQKDNGYTLSVLSAEHGTWQTANLSNGLSGAPGKDGEDGSPGVQGYTPVVNLSETSDGKTWNMRISYSKENSTPDTITAAWDKGVNGVDGFTPVLSTSNVVQDGDKSKISISYDYKQRTTIPSSGTFILSTQNISGEDGKSAYQIAVDNGFVGTEEAWLSSLIGQDGFSPSANVTKSGSTATITVIDKSGTTSANINDGSLGLDISAVMEYFGKVSLLKPTNDDGRALQLSAVFYDDEACSTSAFQIDTATAAGKACTYAFVGGNNSDIDHTHVAGETNVDAAWLRLADWPTRFEDGLGPEFDNYPILLDIRQFVNDDQIMSKLQAKKHLYAKYAWYWYDDNDVAHYSDEYSLVFPSTTEVGASSNSIRTASSSTSASGTNVIDSLDYEFDFGGDDISAALLQPDIPNVLSVGLESGMNFCFKDYSEDKHYIVKFQPKAGSANIARDSIALWSQNVDGTITPLEIAGWTGITATTATSSFVSSRVYVGEFFFGIYANRLSATV